MITRPLYYSLPILLVCDILFKDSSPGGGFIVAGPERKSRSTRPHRLSMRNYRMCNGSNCAQTLQWRFRQRQDIILQIGRPRPPSTTGPMMVGMLRELHT